MDKNTIRYVVYKHVEWVGSKHLLLTKDLNEAIEYREGLKAEQFTWYTIEVEYD